MRRLGLAITTIALLAGTSAFAQTVTTVTGAGANLILNDGFGDPQSGDGAAERYGAQANFSAFHDTAGSPIVFEASNSLARYAATNITSVSVSIGISNPEARDFNFQSTITEAGMGFYVGNTGIGGCVQTGTCAQSALSFNDAATSYSEFAGFDVGDYSNVIALSQFNFDVIGFTAGDPVDEFGNPTGPGTVLYNRSGFALLRLDELSNVLTVGVVNTGLNGGVSDLTGYTPIDNSAGAFTFGWEATNFGFNVGGAITTLRYVSTVTTRTESACANLVFDAEPNEACVIAFAAFGDPIGRGGDADLQSLDFAFSLDGGGVVNQEEVELPGPITGINGERANFTRPQFVNGNLYFQDVSTASIPEPATWAMMIMGFGFLGTAMRRRRAFVRA